MSEPAKANPAEEQQTTDRRTFLSRLSSLAMALGLTAGYGMFAALIGRFLFPAGSTAKSWQFLTDLDSIEPGQSLLYQAPAGQRIAVTRLQAAGTADDFIALSSVCPHLGCQVHWESQNNRFFCPCHNGAFDESGNPIAGPPKDAGQSLSRYPLKVENGLLFIEIPTESFT
ncbi:MAG: ubiquinol-cytochrome c reductase iron-sulfur subunit [Planctomycetes bacterium]|nr:ubiquinol-cytochrome c reductase iron-sulfur subunit [Planctomycetota bacterium]